jgi:hypothetical protein
MFNKYKEFRRKRALDRWVVMMNRDYNELYEISDDDGAHVLEVNYKRKRDR